MSGFDRKNIARYTLIMAHLELLYANGWISDEDFNTLEEVYAQTYHISESSLLRLAKRKKELINALTRYKPFWSKIVYN